MKDFIISLLESFKKIKEPSIIILEGFPLSGLNTDDIIAKTENYIIIYNHDKSLKPIGSEKKIDIKKISEYGDNKSLLALSLYQAGYMRLHDPILLIERCRNKSIFVSCFSLLETFPWLGQLKKINQEVNWLIPEIIMLARKIGFLASKKQACGTIFTIGDHENVLSKSQPFILDPFSKFDTERPKIGVPEINNAICKLTWIEGAFILNSQGELISLVRHIEVPDFDLDLVKGLGSRHAAAISLSKNTACISLVVSQSEGNIRFFWGGKEICYIPGNYG